MKGHQSVEAGLKLRLHDVLVECEAWPDCGRSGKPAKPTVLRRTRRDLRLEGGRAASVRFAQGVEHLLRRELRPPAKAMSLRSQGVLKSEELLAFVRHRSLYRLVRRCAILRREAADKASPGRCDAEPPPRGADRPDENDVAEWT